MYFLATDMLGEAGDDGWAGHAAEEAALAVFIVMSSVFHMIGYWLMIRAATIISHRISDAVQDFARLHAWLACGISHELPGRAPVGQQAAAFWEAPSRDPSRPASRAGPGAPPAGEGQAGDARGTGGDLRGREAVLCYFQATCPAVTVFGMRLDRESLRSSQTVLVSAIVFIATRIIALYQSNRRAP